LLTYHAVPYIFSSRANTEKIGKPYNLKFFGNKATKGPERDNQNYQYFNLLSIFNITTGHSNYIDEPVIYVWERF
jgi:uncharacterized protein YycO